MGQKVNPNIFNFIEKRIQPFEYIEKKVSEYSRYSKTNLDIKKFCKIFFINNTKIINNCNVLYLTNVFHIYIEYYQKVHNYNINPKKNQKNKLIKNYFRSIFKLKQQQFKWPEQNVVKKSLNKLFVRVYKVEERPKANFLLEIVLFLEDFFKSLTEFIQKKYNIFLTIKRLNTNTIVFKKERKKKHTIFIKRKQKLLNLRKYKQNSFFKEGLNTIFSLVKNRNSSKLIAQFIATQLRTLKRHNFFIRFLKNTFNIFNHKFFFSKIKGIKIQIKGRLNNSSRYQVRLVTSKKILPLLTKNLDINYSEETSFTLNGTFGVKVWLH